MVHVKLFYMQQAHLKQFILLRWIKKTSASLIRKK